MQDCTALPGRSRAVLIVAIALGVFASVMSTSMLAIAFPDLVRTFDISYTTLQLRNILFFSVFAVGLPFFGQLADRVGPRRQFFTGMVLFCAASLASGLTTNWYAFLAFQTLQAVADAMIVPVQMSLIRRLFPEEEIGWAFGWFGAVLEVATLGGPALGGILVRHGGVGSIFWCLAGVCGLALVLAWRVVPDTPPLRPHARAADLPVVGTLGLLAAVIGAQVFVYADEAVTRVAGLATAVAGALTLVAGERRGVSRLFPAGLVHNRLFVAATLRIFLLFVAANAIGLFSPSYLREVHGVETRTLGLVLMVEPLLALLVAGWAGRAADRRPHAAITVGLALATAGTGLLALLAPPVWIGAFVAVYFITALGSVLCMPSLNKVALLSVPEEETGNYMGVYQMAQFGSGAFASAILGPMVEQGHVGQVTHSGFQLVAFAAMGLQLLGLVTLLLNRRIRVAIATTAVSDGSDGAAPSAGTGAARPG